MLDKEEVDLANLVNRALLFVRERAGEGGIELDTQLPEELPRLIADPCRLLQILVNLLPNAVKFTPAGGRVTVAVAPAADGGLRISVSDTGAGMRPEEIPLALAPYRQVGEGRQSEGTGLGLPLVKAMTELHGGRLTMESTPDAGTTVTIWLPAERLLAPA